MVGLWADLSVSRKLYSGSWCITYDRLDNKVSGVALLEKLLLHKTSYKEYIEKLVLSFRGFQKSNPHRISLMNIFARKWVLPLITLLIVAIMLNFFK